MIHYSQQNRIFRILIVVVMVVWGSVLQGFYDSDDVTEHFGMGTMFPNRTCEGYAMAAQVDVDGIDNGGAYGNNDTMVVFITYNGEATWWDDGGDDVYFFTPSDDDCLGYFCATDNSCGMGTFIVRFVDMTTAGFDPDNPATWIYTTIPSVRFSMYHDSSFDYDDPSIVDPYQQAKAYKTINNAVPANLIDGTHTYSSLLGDPWTYCTFEDVENGIGELLITTHFFENLISYFYIGHPGIVLLFDTSGSMSWDHNGVSGVPVEEQRLTLAKNAAIPFMDGLLTYGENESDFGIVTFPSHPYTACDTEVITEMTPVTVGSHDTAVTTTIPGFTAEGATPLLAGIDESLSMISSLDPKCIVLLSDGYHNCPYQVEAGSVEYNDMIDDLGDVKVYTIGFSNPGDVDSHFLDELASDTGGSFSDVTADAGFDPLSWDPATALAATYNKILAEGLGLDVVADPPGIINYGEKIEKKIYINDCDKKVSFFVSWKTMDEDMLGVVLYSSDGKEVTIDPKKGVTQRYGKTYKTITVEESFLNLPGKVSVNPWTLLILPQKVQKGTPEYYQYNVVTDSNLKMKAGLDKQKYSAGEIITITAGVSEKGKAMTNVDEAYIEVTCPEDGMGNWFAAYKTDLKDQKIPDLKTRGEILTPIQLKARYLNMVCGIPFPVRTQPVKIKMYDDGSHGDERAADGVYTAQFTNTFKEGTYSFYIHLKGKSKSNNYFKREKLIQKYLIVDASASTTVVSSSFLSRDEKYDFYSITIIPMDNYRNYLGPNYTSTITITPSQGKLSRDIKDNLDGSYEQILSVPAKTNPEDITLTITIQDIHIKYNLKEQLMRSVK